MRRRLLLIGAGGAAMLSGCATYGAQQSAPAAPAAPRISVAEEALPRLTNAAILAEVALTAKYWLIRSNAIARIQDEATLRKVAAEDPHIRIRTTAARPDRW